MGSGIIGPRRPTDWDEMCWGQHLHDHRWSGKDPGVYRFDFVMSRRYEGDHPVAPEARRDDASFRSLLGFPHEQPVVDPQVSHFRHVPLRTRVIFPHSPQASPT